MDKFKPFLPENGGASQYLPSETHKTLYVKICNLLSNNNSYLEVGKMLLPDLPPDTAKGIVWRAHKKNKWTKDNEIRMLLGLPRFLYVQDDPSKMSVPVCTSCGKVHAYDRACEMIVTVKAKREPREKKQRDKYDRFYAWMFEMSSAKDWR